MLGVRARKYSRFFFFYCMAMGAPVVNLFLYGENGWRVNNTRRVQLEGIGEGDLLIETNRSGDYGDAKDTLVLSMKGQK